jgi:hypothetical protein
VATVVGRTRLLGGHRVQTEIQITNWRLSRLTFLPSRTIAEPSSPSRVRCAAPNPRRALDCSGRLCKISPLGRKVDLRKAKKQRQNQNLLDIHRHSHGRRYHNFALFCSPDRRFTHLRGSRLNLVRTSAATSTSKPTLASPRMGRNLAATRQLRPLVTPTPLIAACRNENGEC